ncbi:MAG: hypothetical protein M1167_00965, partial [Chloroflexi bacterium]|nr:hypothetical protein [Chloroflexota bacterium]
LTFILTTVRKTSEINNMEPKTPKAWLITLTHSFVSGLSGAKLLCIQKCLGQNVSNRSQAPQLLAKC